MFAAFSILGFFSSLVPTFLHGILGVANLALIGAASFLVFITAAITQRRGRHGEDFATAPLRYKPRQRGEPGPVSRLVPDPAGVPPQYRVLMPEHQQLSIRRPVTAEHQDGQAEHTAHEHVDDLEQHPAS